MRVPGPQKERIRVHHGLVELLRGSMEKATQGWTFHRETTVVGLSGIHVPIAAPPRQWQRLCDDLVDEDVFPAGEDAALWSSIRRNTKMACLNTNLSSSIQMSMQTEYLATLREWIGIYLLSNTYQYESGEPLMAFLSHIAARIAQSYSSLPQGACHANGHLARDGDVVGSHNLLIHSAEIYLHIAEILGERHLHRGRGGGPILECGPISGTRATQIGRRLRAARNVREWRGALHRPASSHGSAAHIAGGGCRDVGGKAKPRQQIPAITAAPTAAAPTEAAAGRSWLLIV